LGFLVTNQSNGMHLDYYGKKFILGMEVGSVLLCKNKGMFIARKLYGQQ